MIAGSISARSGLRHLPLPVDPASENHQHGNESDRRPYRRFPRPDLLPGPAQCALFALHGRQTSLFHRQRHKLHPETETWPTSASASAPDGHPPRRLLSAPGDSASLTLDFGKICGNDDTGFVFGGKQGSLNAQINACEKYLSQLSETIRFPRDSSAYGLYPEKTAQMQDSLARYSARAKLSKAAKEWARQSIPAPLYPAPRDAGLLPNGFSLSVSDR